MKITYKQDGYDKDVYCNGAKTKLYIVKKSFGGWGVWFEHTEIRHVAYLDDAKECVEGLLKLNIGRDFAHEKA